LRAWTECRGGVNYYNNIEGDELFELKKAFGAASIFKSKSIAEY
jgi:hypothetical protein